MKTMMLVATVKGLPVWVQGEIISLPQHPDQTFVIHEPVERETVACYVISEWTTGRRVLDGVTKRGTIKKASKALERISSERFQSTLDETPTLNTELIPVKASKAPRKSKQAKSREITKPVPAACDICGLPIKDYFWDAPDENKHWADMCFLCHMTHAIQGLGQKYKIVKRKGIRVGVKVKG